MCRNPYIHPRSAQAFGCGQCLPCRINRRRMWTHRIMLEASQHGDNSFVTLTYDDEHLTFTDKGLPTLVPKDWTDFLKRLRLSLDPHRIRYFGVGEYGDQSGRPHYHFAGFNLPVCLRGQTYNNKRGLCCPTCDRIRDTWGKGLIYSGRLETASAAYIAGYVTKRLTRPDDPRLKGRHPEFARMSLKPGIGRGFMDEVASTLMEHRLDTALPDVPTVLAHGNSIKPLGRYLTRALRERIGQAPNAPQSTMEAQHQKMQPMRDAAKATAPVQGFTQAFKEELLKASEGKYRQLEARERLYRKRSSI